MMPRVVTLSLFLTRNLFRTLLGILPPALTLLVYRLTFTYRNQGDPDYFTAVGGLGLALVGVVTAFLVADRANRAAMYPLVARLPRRAELLAATVLSIVMIMSAMATLYTGCVIIFQNMSLTPIELMLIAPRWLVVFVFAATLGVMMSKLASRAGSHLIAWGLLGGMAFLRERVILFDVPAFLTDNVEFIVRPLTYALTTTLEPFSIQILPALMLTLFYAGGLFALAVWLFRCKDLLWVE
jgi:hypothetical protein